MADPHRTVSVSGPDLPQAGGGDRPSSEEDSWLPLNVVPCRILHRIDEQWSALDWDSDRVAQITMSAARDFPILESLNVDEIAGLPMQVASMLSEIGWVEILE